MLDTRIVMETLIESRLLLESSKYISECGDEEESDNLMYR